MSRARAWLKKAVLSTPRLATLVHERDAAVAAARRAERDRERFLRANRRLKRTNERLVKYAEAVRARPRVEDKLGYVFIVTYGRSGSTLLMGILNSIPGYLVRGENEAALYHLYKFHSTCNRNRRAFTTATGALEPTHPWFGIDDYPAEPALQQLRGLVLDTLIRPSAASRVVGVKEIRWQQRDLVDYVRFLQRLFPGAKFVFNTRDHEHVVKSKWWADYPNALAEAARVENLQREVCETLGDAAFRVHYDDYVRDPAVLKDLFAWLGEDFDEQAVRDVMAQQHSY